MCYDLLQTFDVPTIQGPCLVSVQKIGEHNGPEVHDFRSHAVITVVPVRERSIGSMNRFDPVVKVSSAADIIRDDTVKVGKFIVAFYRLSVDVDADVRCCLSGGRLDENPSHQLGRPYH